MRKLVAVLCAFFIFAMCFTPVAFASGGQKYAPDRILVGFKPGVSPAAKAKIHSKHGGRVLKENTDLGVQVVQVPSGMVMEKVAEYQSEKDVAFAEPDYVARATFIPNDPYFSLQWGLNNSNDADIDAPEAWDVSRGNSVKVAVLDTGIDCDHEDLAGKVVASANFTTSVTADDLFGHGTHVAGIIAAVTNNSKGVAGVAPNCVLMNVKVLDDQGNGYYSWIANGIVWAANNGAKVINMSLAGPAPSSTLKQAIDYAWRKGAVIVAAAGNDGTNAPSYPAYYDKCIAVAATDQNDQRASFSEYGSWVDVSAPGVNILSTLPNHANALGVNNYGYMSGTSMATPFVSGVAALVWATPYGKSNSSVVSRIENTADRVPGTGVYWLYGRVNAWNAVH